MAIKNLLSGLLLYCLYKLYYKKAYMSPKLQVQKLQSISAVQIIAVASIYSFLLMMSFGVISMNPHEIPHLYYGIALGVLSFGLFLFVTASLYKGIVVASDKPRLDAILRFRKPDLFNWKWIAEFMSPAEGLGSIILGMLLWVVSNIVLICFYYILAPLVITISILFGCLVYFVFLKPIKSIFTVTERCKGSLTKGIFASLFFTVMYNVFLLVLGLITYGLFGI